MTPASLVMDNGLETQPMQADNRDICMRCRTTGFRCRSASWCCDLADITHDYVVLKAFPLGYTAQTKASGSYQHSYQHASACKPILSESSLLETETSSAASGKKADTVKPMAQYPHTQYLLQRLPIARHPYVPWPFSCMKLEGEARWDAQKHIGMLT